MSNIITNGYGVGVDGKNLVLKTQGRIYVKVKDRFYELKFRPEDFQNEDLDNENLTTQSNIVFVNNNEDVDNLEYPGDGSLVISLDGNFYAGQENILQQIPIRLTSSDLTLNNLIVNNQLTFNNTSGNTPIVLNTNTLIPNLNAQYLDGRPSNNYSIKSENEAISGKWTFQNGFIFKDSVGINTLTDQTQQNVYIDFNNGNATFKNLTITGNITLPEEQQEYSLINGTNGETWVGTEYTIDSNYEMLEDYNLESPNAIYQIEMAYEKGYLPDTDVSGTIELDLDFWYGIFCTNYNAENATYTLRDMSDPESKEYAQDLLNGTGLNINDYLSVYYNSLEVNLSEFNGNYYNINFNFDYGSVNINDIIKTSNNNLAVVCEIFNNGIVVKSQNNNFDGVKIVVIGNQDGRCGICFKSNGENTPYLTVYDNPIEQSESVLRIGNLSGIEDTQYGPLTTGIYMSGNVEKVVNELSVNTIKHAQYPNCGVYIKNPVLRFGDSTIFNPDDSGIIANGCIQWLNTKLKIANAEILNSSYHVGSITIDKYGNGNICDKIEFDQTTVIKNIPIGEAGGDLEGSYPNPSISSEIKNKITSLESKITELEERIAALE